MVMEIVETFAASKSMPDCATPKFAYRSIYLFVSSDPVAQAGAMIMDDTETRFRQLLFPSLARWETRPFDLYL
jgi:hypothetical protein